MPDKAYLTSRVLTLRVSDVPTTVLGKGLRTCRDGTASVLREAALMVRAGRSLDPEWLRAAATRLAAATPPWDELTWATPEHRSYRLLGRSSDIEVWANYWPSGGNLELHDHGGHSGSFAVVEGELDETFTTTLGGPLRQRRVRRGQAVAFDRSHVHHLLNTSPISATTVHIYDGPQSAMTMYRMSTDGQLVATRIAVADEPRDALPLVDLPTHPTGWIDLEAWAGV
jgi:hypothetical protein